jgi:uncharacterized protein (UPF0276 family)
MARILAAITDAYDVLEIEPQTLSPALAGRSDATPCAGDLAEVLAFPHPKVVHSVGMPFGNGARPTPAEIGAVKFAADAVDSPWVSDHLSFNGGRTGFAGFLLPLPQGPGAVRHAAARIRWMRDTLRRDVLFETGVNYLRPGAREMPDGEFLAAVAESADCGILLDLHNLWTNERNGREAVARVIDDLPLDRVVEIHLAHGNERAGYWVDAHSGLTSSALIEIAWSVVPRLPNLRLITFEMAPDYVPVAGIGADDLARHLGDLRLLASSAGPSDPAGRPARSERRECIGGTGAGCPALGAWRDELTLLVNGRSSPAVATDAIRTDPGLGLYRELVAVGRSSAVVGAAPLTARLLVMLGGPHRLESIVEDFRARSPACPLPADELRGLDDYLAVHGSPDLRVAHEVLRFERALLQTAADGRPRTVTFSTDPTALLPAIGAGRAPVPAAGDSTTYELTIVDNDTGL